MASDDAPQTINWAIAAENREPVHRERRYVLDHLTHLRALELELTSQAHIVGYYHSHPNDDVRPSPRDRKFAGPGPVYLIVSACRKPARYAAWRLANGEFAQTPLEERE
jgi:proteasome lid subunit RPN8/RPN11